MTTQHRSSQGWINSAQNVLRRGVASLAAFALLVMSVAPASAEITGYQAEEGSGTLEQDGNHTNLHQHSDKLSALFDKFNLSEDEVFHLIQSGDMKALFRVLGGRSELMGQIKADNFLIFINQNGIVFGENANIDLNNAVFSTTDISTANFMADRYVFDRPGNPDAKIINNGNITVREGGMVALVAPWVENNGVIAARLGKVQVAAADTFAVDFYGDGLIQLELDEDRAAQVVGVSNNGTISADGGAVLMTTAAAKGVVDTVVNMDGVIEANSVGTQNGEIVLFADKGTTTVNGTISAQGKQVGETGGNVKVLGKTVTVASGAEINADGQAGGGEIRIGGGVRGEEGLAHAETTTIEAGATISADALDAGNGGTVVVWSDGNTNFAGDITAEGGANAGDGGFVEISGHHLDLSGTVSTAAANGEYGSLLLDPEDIYIVLTAGANPNVTYITIAFLQAQLLAGNVIIQTNPAIAGNGDIIWQSDADLSNSNSTNLTLNAHNRALLAGDFKSRGGFEVLAGGAVEFQVAKFAVGGDLVVDAQDYFYSKYSDVTAGGDIRLSGYYVNSTGSNFTANNEIVLTGGHIGMNGTNLTTTNGDIRMTSDSTSLLQSGRVSLFFSDVNAGRDLFINADNGISSQATDVKVARDFIASTGGNQFEWRVGSTIDVGRNIDFTLTGPDTSFTMYYKARLSAENVRIAGNNVIGFGTTVPLPGGDSFINVRGDLELLTKGSVYLSGEVATTVAGDIEISAGRTLDIDGSLASTGGKIELTGATFSGAKSGNISSWSTLSLEMADYQYNGVMAARSFAKIHHTGKQLDVGDANGGDAHISRAQLRRISALDLTISGNDLMFDNVQFADTAGIQRRFSMYGDNITIGSDGFFRDGSVRATAQRIIKVDGEFHADGGRLADSDGGGFVLTAGGFDFNAAVSGSGELYINSLDRDLVVGDVGTLIFARPSTFIGAPDIDMIQDGFDKVQYSAGSNHVYLGDAIFKDPTVFESRLNRADAIITVGNVQGIDNASLTYKGNAYLKNSITTQGTFISFLGDRNTLTDDLFISTGTGAGSITFLGRLDGVNDMEMTAGTGDIVFLGGVGTNRPLGDVTINSAGNVTSEQAFNANRFDQLAGTGTTDFRSAGLNATTGVGILTRDIRGTYAGAGLSSLRADGGSIIADVDLEDLVVELTAPGNVVELTGSVSAGGDQRAADTIGVNTPLTRASGADETTYTLNGFCLGNSGLCPGSGPTTPTFGIPTGLGRIVDAAELLNRRRSALLGDPLDPATAEYRSSAEGSTEILAIFAADYGFGAYIPAAGDIAVASGGDGGAPDSGVEASQFMESFWNFYYPATFQQQAGEEEEAEQPAEAPVEEAAQEEIPVAAAF